MSQAIGFTVTGIEGVIDNMEMMFKAHIESAAKGLKKWAYMVMNEARRLCPVDTGLLRASGYVDDVVMYSDRVLVQLGFSQEYALAVHERMNVFHKVGQAKYLEAPFLRYVDDMVRTIAASIWKDIAGG